MDIHYNAGYYPGKILFLLFRYAYIIKDNLRSFSRNVDSLFSLKGPYGRPPYTSSGISQNIQPSFGRKRRSTRSGITQANERYAWYGNSLNKAGICPLYGRRKRFAEADKNKFQPRYLLILKKCTNINV